LFFLQVKHINGLSGAAFGGDFFSWEVVT